MDFSYGNLMHGSIELTHPEFPALLKLIPDPPKVLYYKGLWRKEIFDQCLAVVGSRRITSYAKLVATREVAQLARSGITIVSGFMYGVDVAAHQAALSVGGKTVAVMPCGIDTIHPYYQKHIYKEILEKGGLVVSEYPGESQPQLWTYPKRNRIVAGLCKAVLVLEASEKSGSLITAELAKRFGRGVYAVPGQIISSSSQGTNSLLKNGARMFTSAEDIVCDFGLSSSYPILRELNLFKGADEKDVISCNNNKTSELEELLYREPLNIDQIAQKTGRSVQHLCAEISVLVLMGRLTEEGGKYYAY